MSSIFGKVIGFGKRKRGGTVTERKEIKRKMVRAMVKKLKAAGKPVDLQAINKEVFDLCRRRHQRQMPKHNQ